MLAGFLAWLGVGLPILVLCACLSGAAGGLLGAYLVYSADLPSIPDLRAYRPKTVSTFYAEDGSVIGLFYREKRFPVPVSSLPPHVVHAFLAAEDARFYQHPGVDWFGIARAVVRNVETGGYTQGGSTITQQVTRNFLLTKEKKISRKIREGLLAVRLEKTLKKDEILELYLNEIYLGQSAYGIESAAGTYFGKPAAELSIAEAALIAGLVANPSRYTPARNTGAALKRREFVLGRMLQNGFITEAAYRAAMQEQPKFRESLPNPFDRVPYFTEAVRQYIVAKYGEDRLYHEGLRVWTTCDVNLQGQASDALLRGVKAWEKRQGRPVGLIKRLKKNEAKEFLADPGPESYQVGEFIRAMVVAVPEPPKGKKKQDSGPLEYTLALHGDRRFTMPLESGVRYRPNDLLEFRVKAMEGTKLSLEPWGMPPVQGAVVCMENRTGFVKALVGGLDFERSTFNRALQARRQPGSAFKPFVFAGAFEWAGYSPHSLVVDEPIAVEVTPRAPVWIPANSDGEFAGPIMLRDALAHSRNITAVKLLMDVGIEPTAALAHRMGISSRLGANISLALGVSEVSPFELTAAYSVFPNMGMRVPPVLVKKVVDRFGRVLEDNTGEPLDVEAAARVPLQQSPWPGAASEESAGNDDDQSYGRAVSAGTAPARSDHRRPAFDEFGVPTVGLFPTLRHLGPAERTRVVSPQTAYLMASALRQTCVSGTAAAATRLKRKDLAGKTGTTDDCSDAWFVGFNPKYTVGVWMGQDAKVSLGRGEYGGRAALPVWMDFMKAALSETPSTGYPVPPGIVFTQGVPNAKRVNLAELLEAGPDFSPARPLKEVSPIDTVGVPATVSLGGYSQYHMENYYMPSTSPSTMRVLSPTGETLGHAYYAQDERGKLSLQRVAAADNDGTSESADDADQAPESFLSRGGRMLRNLPEWIRNNPLGGALQ